MYVYLKNLQLNQIVCIYLFFLVQTQNKKIKTHTHTHYLSMSVSNKDKRRRVLCLGGGGSRCLFIVQFLKQLEKDTNNPTHNLFDLIVGVSSGGIVAAAAAAGFSGDEISYKTIQEIFSDIQTLGPIFRLKYKGLSKKKVLENLFGNLKMKDLKTNVSIICCSMSGELVIINSWVHKELFVRDVVDATSAASCFFPPVVVDGTKLIDGGIIDNVGVTIAYLEAKKLFKNNNMCILRLGTSRKDINLEKVDDEEHSFVNLVAAGLFDISMRINCHLDDYIVKDILGDDKLIVVLNDVFGSLDRTDKDQLKKYEENGRRLYKLYKVKIIRMLFSL